MTRPSVEWFARRVIYDPESGALTWLARAPADFTSEAACARWNAKHAGKQVTSKLKGYIVVKISAGGQKACVGGHVLAFAMTTGRWPVDLIDHKDRRPLNNRWLNLREATDAQNRINVGKRNGVTSSFKGVYWSTECQKWGACIDSEKEREYLGLYRSEQEAAAAYNVAARRLHGEFACLNDVPDMMCCRITYKLGDSGIRGVTRHRNGWMAKRRGKYLGVFPTVELASDAIEKASVETA